jgi:hypothetical protein
MKDLRLGVAVAAATALLALPSAVAAAPTLSVDRPCYTPGQAIKASGGGYTPGGEVMMNMSVFSPFGNTYYFRPDPLIADAGGNISETARAPELASNKELEETASLAANDQQRIQQNAPQEEAVGSAIFKLSIFAVAVVPWGAHKGDPRKLTRFSAYGFEGLGPVLYAHYFLRGKLKKTVRVGALAGDCGNLTKKMRQFPFRPVPPGDYRIDFDTSRTYSSKAEGIRFAHVKVAASKAVP